MKTKGLKYLTPVERRALKEYLERLRTEYGREIQRVILYGSKVRGDFDEESDIDVCVVVKTLDSKLRRALIALGVDVDLKHSVLIGDFIVDQARFEQMAKYREPIYRNMMAEGIELWTTKPEPSLRKNSNARKKTLQSPNRSKGKAVIANPLAVPTMPSLRQRAPRSSRKTSRVKSIPA